MRIKASDLRPGDKYKRFGKVLTVKQVDKDSPGCGMLTIQTPIGPTQSWTVWPDTMVEVVERGRGSDENE